MVSLISQWGHKNGAYEYVIDTLSDLENVPTDVAVGTVVFCIENSKTYMLNGSGVYVEVNFKKGGKGGDKKLDSKEIYENGVYRAEDYELDGFTQVEVEVANSYVASDEGKVVDNGVLVAQSSQTVTQNNTYDTTLINSMTVNVPSSSETIIGINPTDENEYCVETDNNDYLVETLLPSKIEVVTPPTKTTYTDGETVDITDMVVKAYSRDDNLWNSTGYTGGVIPHSELTIEPIIAHGSGVSTDEWNVRNTDLTPSIYMKQIYVGMTFEGEEGVTGSRYITEMENTSPVYMIQFDRGDNQKDHLYVSLEYFKVRSRRVCPSSWDANWRWDNGSLYNVSYDGNTYSGYTGGYRGSSVWNIDVSTQQSNDRGSDRNAVLALNLGRPKNGEIDVAVKWNRPNDNKLLTATFEVNVS